MRGFDFVPPNNQGQSFKPEFGDQIEGSIKLNLFKWNLSSTINYYNIKVKDKIRMDINNPPFSIQDGTHLSSGVDVDKNFSRSKPEYNCRIWIERQQVYKSRC